MLVFYFSQNTKNEFPTLVNVFTELSISLSSLLFIAYYVVAILVCLRIIYDTQDTAKATAYILLVLLLPIVGILVYFSFGVNYRKRRLYKKKLRANAQVYQDLDVQMEQYSVQVIDAFEDELRHFKPLATLASREYSITTHRNRTTLLRNGEEKFPDLLRAIKAAKSHIHLEYYIFDADQTGHEIMDALVEKAAEGVEVRIIYDDFGSNGFRRNFRKKLAGTSILTAPFYKIRLLFLANSLNYRNHRKIAVIDGKIGYVGGINVGDDYYNREGDDYWKDTHLKIEGLGVYNLQYIFLTDWNFCAGEDISISETYFPAPGSFSKELPRGHIVQISASGPDSPYANILYTLVQAITLSRKEVFIVTPYFIPDRAFLDALKISALSGVDVRVLIPGTPDSVFVGAASNTYMEDLLEIGVKVYHYQKGFIHAKTMVCDSYLSIIGTANLDQRSFDINFEINAINYQEELAQALRADFLLDLEDAVPLELEAWRNRSKSVVLFERMIRLFSPLL
ncbi:MAG: cardiolipin synthase [Bacteroidetes bacterium]|nr:cardiolipin synthase [Bacteroidota bacterium]